MQIGIFYNENQVERSVAESFAALLGSRGAHAFVCASSEAILSCDRLAVLGGDGTVLHAAKAVAERGIPLVGVNFGRIGFLTEFEKEELAETADLLLGDSAEILARSMLETEFGGKIHRCLNEFALLRNVSPERANRVENISVTIDGYEAGDYLCDGLIAATPTGSTAYSLSAGGNIMLPDCEAFLLTPVCAFSLRSRPIVFSDASVLKLSVAENDALMAYADGGFLGVVAGKNSLVIKKSLQKAVFLTRNKHSFFARLTKKIN